MAGETRIVRNAARCRLCDDVIESKTVHDWVSCKCGAIFVDGGHEYVHCGGYPENFESLCETVPVLTKQEQMEEESNG